MRRVWGWIVAGVRLEINLYVALARWIVRRRAVPAGAAPWGYARMVTPVMWLWIFGSAMEVPLAHVITPWPTVRLVLLGLGVWGLLWMIGMLASYHVYPHLVDETGVRVRLGKRADVLVPWGKIARAATIDRDLPSTIRTFQPLEIDNGVDLQIGVSGRANVHLGLSEPMEITVKGEQMTVAAVTIFVDDPREFVAMLEKRSSTSIR